jgi:hypothetical protein
LSVLLRLGLGERLRRLRNASSTEVFSTSATLAGHQISAECDDRQFFPDFFVMFGGPPPRPGPATPGAHLQITLRAPVDSEYGWFHLRDATDTPFDCDEFRFALADEPRTFTREDVDEPGWTCLTLKGADRPTFAFHGQDCLFSLGPDWRRAVNWHLFWRLLRMRSDAIFFHASAVGIGGIGTMFVGPSGAGKSTTSVALAARGHEFLSDEVAGYVTATGELIPFRRPVGIKPGPRAQAVVRGLPEAEVARIEQEGFSRVDIETLFPVRPAQPLPLGRIVFLRGFAARPDLARIEPGRAEVAELQPLMSSFLNESHGRRVFDLVRLLGRSRVYRLHPGDPDETADYLQDAFARE